METPEENHIEEERLMRLEQSRRPARLMGQAQAKREQAPQINIIEGGLVLGFVILMDLADYFVVGLIPILGDILDLITGAIIFLWVKTRGLDRGKPLFFSWSPGIATLIEFIPFLGDLVPTFTFNVLVIIALNTSWGKRLARVLSPL
jgi:hypothetical protein